MLLHEALRFVGHLLGASLAVFLCVLVSVQRGVDRTRALVSMALAAVALWHGARVVALFQIANVGAAPGWLEPLGQAGAALLPALLFHLALISTGRGERPAAIAYAASAAAWWAFRAGRSGPAWLFVGAGIGTAAVLAWNGARLAVASAEKTFLRALAATSVGVLVAAALFGTESAVLVLASVAPLALFASSIYRHHILGLAISRRIPFALTLGTAFAFYLFFVRRLAGFVEEEFEAFGALTEAALILAAALIWIPLYGWMNRFLLKRTRVFADFSKRLIEEAAHILDLAERLDYLAGELGRIFELRRVLIAAGDVCGRFGSWEGGTTRLADLWACAARAPDMVHSDRTRDAQARQLLKAEGFNYLFPLRYEGRLIGLLVLDTSPRHFLGDDEAILLALTRQISHSIETCRLVEDKIRLERTLARQEHLAALGKVAAAIAHEVKNPLSSVKTLVQLMREDPGVRSRYERDLDFMVNEVDRLNRTVQQLLSFSRPAPESREDVDAAEVVREIGEMLEREPRAGIRIERRVTPGLVLRNANSELLRQIVLNLALNAVEASPPGGTVTLEARANDNRICIAVQDEGPGVPPELHAKIFEPFFTTKRRGTGLGLTIVRKNVRQLGGDIRVESPAAEGKGTRFVIVLPPG